MKKTILYENPLCEELAIAENSVLCTSSEEVYINKETEDILNW